MADVTKTVAIVFQGQDETGGAIAKVETNLSGIEKNAAGAKTSVQGLNDQVDRLGNNESIDKVSGALQAFATGLVAKEFVEANVRFEQFERAMVLLKGSTNAAAAEFSYISDVSNKLGIDLRGASDSYVLLTAATKGTSLEGQQTREIFEAVSKAMSSLGKSSADTNGALLAISQIVSKGNVSMEELRGQLGERLPVAMDAAARGLGITKQQLEDVVASGNLTAEEFLPKFAAALRETFGETAYVDGFEASLNRMRAALDQAFISLGKAGVFDLLIDGLKIATASVTGFVGALTFLNEVTTPAFKRDAAVKDFGANWDQALERAANKTRAASDALQTLSFASKGAGDAAKEAGPKVKESLSEADTAAAQAAKQTEALQKQLKDLGVDPKKVKDPLFDIVKAFEQLAQNPAVKGDQIFAGFEAALKKAKTLEDLGGLGSSLVTAFGNGKISSDEFRKATELLATAQDKVQKALEKSSGSGKKQEDALKKQAEAADKAQEAARKYQLEMEKLASNERIKLIEARVQLNATQVENDTKRIIAAFESLNKGFESTEKLSAEILKGFKDIPSEFDPRFKVFKQQLEKETSFREQQFKLQKELVKAQIEQMRAQTKALERGDSIIKIDGAGLQPHLEAFMWEILRTIQVRVNQDGLKMLLGV